MRPIKYRFWDKHEKKMYYNVGFSMIGVQAYKDELVPEVKILDTGRDNGELLEFIGLHDKNGKEIYEGDVVQSITNFYGNEKVRKTIIEFQNIENDSFGEPTTIGYLIHGHSFEIIGNFYENPELVENK